MSMTVSNALPDWLAPASAPVPAPVKRGRKVETPLERSRRELVETVYAHKFEVVLERMYEGHTLTDILSEDHRDIDRGAFRSWILKNAERRARYYEAKTVFADVIEDDMLRIADGADDSPLPEDLKRTEMRLSTRKWLLQVNNRQRYGETKQIELGGQISILNALEQAKQRAIDGVVLDSVRNSVATAAIEQEIQEAIDDGEVIPDGEEA